MRRNLIVILLALLLIFVIGYGVLPKHPTAPADVLVEHSADGFNPNEITVTVGTTVGWQNTSGKPMWVASDPHPLHTNLLGFDQNEIGMTRPGGDIYLYTFTSIGVWRYHNHVNPGEVGTVTVIDK